MMADYCSCLKCDEIEMKHTRKSLKRKLLPSLQHDSWLILMTNVSTVIVVAKDKSENS